MQECVVPGTKYLISTLFCIALHHTSPTKQISIYIRSLRTVHTHTHLRNDAVISEIRLLDVVGKSLGLLEAMAMPMIIMTMAVILRPNILHLDDIAALAAALVRALAANRQPQLVVAVSGHARAPHVLLLARRPHYDRVFERAQP